MKLTGLNPAQEALDPYEMRQTTAPSLPNAWGDTGGTSLASAGGVQAFRNRTHLEQNMRQNIPTAISGAYQQGLNKARVDVNSKAQMSYNEAQRNLQDRVAQMLYTNIDLNDDKYGIVALNKVLSDPQHAPEFVQHLSDSKKLAEGLTTADYV